MPTSHHPPKSNFLLRFVANFLVLCLALNAVMTSFLVSAAFASELPLTPDGTTNTQIDRAANDVPIVNIAAPNASGLSHNKFTEYNVNESGLILNNATGSQNGVIQTQLGGLVNDNANLRNSGAASVILNEVTSNSISQINGYTEIAGRRADLILANPNGFVMNGAGFINLSRMTAVVGSANQTNPVLDQLTFSLASSAITQLAIDSGFLPKLTIQGNGLDLENITSVDLVANLMNIVAPIYGKDDGEVYLRAGDKTFNYTSKAVSSNAKDSSITTDQLAIDASSLAKIQSGRIYIIASKEGFGIKWDGDMLAARSGIEITAEGNITYKNIESKSVSSGGNSGSNNSDNSNGGKISLTTNKGTLSQTDGSTLIADEINITSKQNDFTLQQNSSLIADVININSTLTSNSASSPNITFAENSLVSSKNQSSSNLTLNIGNVSSNSTVGNSSAGVNSFTNYAKIIAKNNLTITSANNLINGSLTGNNSNVEIVAGSNLTITAQNLISNYATLSAKTDLTLTSISNNITNNQNAEIIGGAGKLSLTAKNGTVNQNSLHSLVSNGDLTLDVTDFINTGRVDIKGNFTLNVANNLTNEAGALIYSGGNMELNVVNNLTNKSGAVIYSEGDLTIQKYALSNLLYDSSNNGANNRINQLDNISAEITSHAGNVTILAKTINNKRDESVPIYLSPIKYGEAGFDATNLDAMGWYYYTTWLFGHIDENQAYIFSGRLRDNPESKQAVISSGKNLSINSDNITNSVSSIYSIGDLTIDASSSFKNESKAINETFMHVVTWHMPWQDPWYTRIRGSCCSYTEQGSPYKTIFAPTIKSGASVAINATNVDQTYVSSGANGVTVADSDPQLINSKNVENILTNGTININLTNYLNGPNESGLFQKSTNPSEPLFETRSQFVDQSKYFGSDYFYQKIGLNLTDVQTQFQQQDQRLVGDQFFQNKIITEQLQTISKNSFLLSQSETDSNKEIQNLIDNSANEYARLGLTANKPLTQSQINNLQKDIVWFETQTILFDSSGSICTKCSDGKNGVTSKTYIVPKVYLSQATRDALKDGSLATNATIYATKDITITASNGSITNSGSIIAGIKDNSGATISGGNITLTAKTDITNKNFSTIKAANNLTITSTAGSITNFSQLQATGALTLDAAKDITNSATVLTNDKNLLNSGSVAYISNGGAARSSGNIQSTLLETAKISAGSITIKAGNDFTNNGANIETTKNTITTTNSDGSTSTTTTSGNLSITAGDDINIGTVQLRNRSETSWGSRKKGGIEITDTTTNIASNITSAGNLSLSATGGGADVEGVKYTEISNQKQSETSAIQSQIDQLKLQQPNTAGKSANNLNQQISNLQNQLNAVNEKYDEQLSSLRQNVGSAITITGSKLTANDNITLAAKDDVTIQAAQDLSYKESQSWKRGTTVSKSSASGSNSVTNVLSTLTSNNGDISVSSGSDTSLIGAKLKAEDVTINAGDEINVYSVSDKNSSWATSSKSRNLSGIADIAGAGIILDTMMYAGGAASIAGGLGTALLVNYGINSQNKSNSSSISTEKTTNVAGIIEAKGDVTLNSNQDLTIKGSNVSGKTGSLTSEQGNVNILSAVEMEKNSSSSSSTSRNTDIPGFNGSKKSSNSSETIITNIASNLDFTDSLKIETKGDSSNSDSGNINIKGSNVSVSNGDLTLASANNITIENAVDSTLQESGSKKRNETTKSFQQSIDYVERAVSSNLNANNINIQSKGDTIIQGSNINTENNLIIGSFTIAQNADGTYQKDENGNYVTTANTTVDNLIIRDAELKEFHDSQKGKGFTGVAGVAMRIAPYVLAPVQIAGDLVKETMSTFLPNGVEDALTKNSNAILATSAVLYFTPMSMFVPYQNALVGTMAVSGIVSANQQIDRSGLNDLKISEESSTRTERTTSVASNINVGNNMMTNSVGDTLIKGSNINVGTNQDSVANGGGNLLANSLGNFTITAGTNTKKSATENSYETAGQFHSDLNVRRLNYTAGVSKDINENGSELNSSTLSSSNLNIAGSALINSADQFNLIASNMIVGIDQNGSGTGGALEIAAKNNLNISDGKNTQSTSSYDKNLNIDTGIRVGNAYADAAYAIVDAVEAQKKVKEAYDKLDKLEEMQKEGTASSKAVERAKQQVVLALINAGMSAAAAMQAVGSAGASSGTLGFYGSVYANITNTKATTSTELTQSLASNLIVNNDLSLTSGQGDLNITGSNVSSQNGNINLTAMLGNLNITAGESTYSQESKMRSQSLGGSVGNNGYSANLGFAEAASSLDQTTFTNSQITAQNGSLNITTGNKQIGTGVDGNDLIIDDKGNATIFGANLLAQNINMNIANNLTVKSKQNLMESDSYNFGMNIGVSGGGGSGGSSGSSGGVNGGSLGVNIGDSYSNRSWVDQMTTIIGTNSVNINVGTKDENGNYIAGTGNTNIVGAMIANISNANDLFNQTGQAHGSNAIDGGNLTLNTGSLTFSDIKNFSVSESNQFGMNLSLGFNSEDPSAPQNSQNANSQQARQNGVVPGSLALNMSMQGSESSSNTKATIGNGTINIGGKSATEEQLSGLNRDIANAEQNKKSVITSDFDANLNIDTRLIAAAVFGAMGDKDKASANLNSYNQDIQNGKDALVRGAGNVVVGGALVGGFIGDAITLINNDEVTDPLNSKSYLDELADKQKLRVDAIFNPQKFVGDSTNKKYYFDSKDGLYGLNTEDGVSYINLANNTSNQQLFETTIHENDHPNSFYGNLTKEQEEAAVSRNTNIKLDLINFYHTQSNYDTFSTASGLLSNLTSWGLNNSSFSNEYQQANSFVTNYYTNTLSTVSMPQLIANNFEVSGLNKSTVETYQKDVHKYLTRYIAENAGLTSEEARQVAAGNYRVDTRWNTQPLTSDSFMDFIGSGRPKEDYHFTSPERLAEMRKVAFESGDKKLLGQYLHAYQDSFSHQKDGVTYDTTWGHSDLNFRSWFMDVGLTENKVPISYGLMNDGIGGFGEYVDRTYNRPELADQMAKGTYSEIQEFIKYQNSRVPNDWQQIINQTNQFTPIPQPVNNWDQILNRVQKFNRTINDNNDEKGQTLFR
jgi:filamentous hemagglutinin family protein